jgi:hypothetical protein
MNEREIVCDFAKWLANYFDGDAGQGEEGFLTRAEEYLASRNVQ